jgi:hypothetical protein
MGHTKPVNVAVMLWACSREVIGSNLAWDIVYFDWSVSWFCLFPSGKYRDSPSNRPRSHPFQFIVHVSYKTIFRCLSQFFTNIQCDNAPDSYTEGPRFKYRPEHRISWMKFVMAFSLSTFRPDQCSISIRPRAAPSISFLVHLSSWHLTPYSLDSDSVVK